MFITFIGVVTEMKCHTWRKTPLKAHSTTTATMMKSGVAQIRFYLVILWKSQEISLLIKVFCLLSDYSKTCTKCRSTIEDLFQKVSLKLVKRWRIFINGEFHKYLLRKIRSSWIWATPDCNLMQKYWKFIEYSIHNWNGPFRHVREGIPIRIYCKIQYQTCLPNRLQFYFWWENQIFHVQRRMEVIRR